ncbi:alpha/beta hydrolase family protein [Hymenobacter radiodurans]|uniref:alpha/beta hydrolase family protein n=1 Tax=Hymenobacter radiodurans TaxID=2496028 RepID=UPI0010591E98|nr:hypothetical protein [Hymenobacter radiodurans]
MGILFLSLAGVLHLPASAIHIPPYAYRHPISAAISAPTCLQHLSAGRCPGSGGKWSGTLKIPNGKLLQLQLHISDNNGKPTASLDIPTQNARGIAVERVEVRGDSLLLQSNAIRASFAGRIAPTGGLITGKWRQNGAKLPLLLQRTSTAVVAAAAAATPTIPPSKPVASKNAKRPQEPQTPFPYREEEVRFTNKSAGINFAGTLTVPQGAGPFPAVVLLSGSGAQNRDQAVFGHRPFWVIADYLTRRGIAVLRFDDRGVGQSGAIRPRLRPLIMPRMPRPPWIFCVPAAT